MGHRRLGRLRLHADLLNKYGKPTTSTAGTGIASTIVSSTTLRQGHEIVTEIAVDLGASVPLAAQNLKAKNNGTGYALGISSSSGTHAASPLITLNIADNGHLVAADMICLETPTLLTGTLKDIDLIVFNGATQAYNNDISAGTKIIDAGADWAVGDHKSWSTGTALTNGALAVSGNVPGDTLSVYLATGASVAADNTYSGGKYVIRLYGIAVPDDK